MSTPVIIKLRWYAINAFGGLFTLILGISGVYEGIVLVDEWDQTELKTLVGIQCAVLGVIMVIIAAPTFVISYLNLVDEYRERLSWVSFEW